MLSNLLNLNVIMCALAIGHALVGRALRTSKEVALMTIYMFTTAIGVLWIWTDSGYKLDTWYVPPLLLIALLSVAVSLFSFTQRNKGTDKRKKLFRNLLLVGSVVFSVCWIITIWDEFWTFVTSLFPSWDALGADMKHTLWLAGALLLIVIGFLVLLKGHLHRDHAKGMNFRNWGIGICTIGVLALAWYAIDVTITLYHS